jgi:hypothetical protein
MMLYTAMEQQVQTQLFHFSSLQHYSSILVANMFWTDATHSRRYTSLLHPASSPRKSQDKESRTVARNGSLHPFIGSEPTCGISGRVAGRAIGGWVCREHQKHWQSIPEQKYAKGLLARPSAKRVAEFPKLGRIQTRQVTGLLTGLCHFFKLGKLLPHLQEVPPWNRNVLAYPMWLRGLGWNKISSAGQVFLETRWLSWDPAR